MTIKRTISQIQTALPVNAWSTDTDRISGYLSEWRNRWQGRTPLLATPRDSEQVAKIVKICAANKTPITTQGGNTGLVGGQIPQGEILLSTKYLNQVRSISADDMAMVCEAGVTVLDAQSAAADIGQKFPLSLASEGSCTIGGVLSTNAGGVHVIKYGTASALCLGVEAVLANGEIFNGLSSLRKDNTGYDISRLLLGAEGTLGIITAASLKLFPRPDDTVRVFVGFDSPAKAAELLSHVKSHAGLSMFELMPDIGMQAVLAYAPTLRRPLSEPYGWYGLLEFELFGDSPDRVHAIIETAFDADVVRDAVISKNQNEAAGLLALRENLSAAQKTLGASIKHDITVPTSQIPTFLEQANDAVTKAVPGARPFPFGHMGDGNIHYNIAQPPGMSALAYMALEPQINAIIYDLVGAFGGSISAEHGIGVLRKDELARRADPAKLAVMRAVKSALDPDTILNPRLLISQGSCPT